MDIKYVNVSIGDFSMDAVEAPATWSDKAVGIVAKTYFAEGEKSVFKMLERVTSAIANKGEELGYFPAVGMTKEAFYNALYSVLLEQKVAFNTPVWINIGVPGRDQQAWACAILNVEDDMESIKEGWGIEAKIFEGGSGSGVNVSKIRANGEPISGGGYGSGPISLWMRPTDSIANVVKSGGKSRRAAKMVVMDVDHPEVMEFIECKANAERMSRVLQANGFDISMQGKDSANIPFQQANNSVRVTDKFMEAVLNDQSWDLTWRTNGKVSQSLSAREIWKAICTAAWDCGDPGIQFHDTINRFHTCMNDGEQRASNPCVAGDTEVSVILRDSSGKELDPEFVHIDSIVDTPCMVLGGDGEFHPIAGSIYKGNKRIWKLNLVNGSSIGLTPDHLVMTDRGDVAVMDLEADFLVQVGLEGENKFVRIHSIEELNEVVPVYDIWEPATDHFVANGIVVHNCSEYLWLDDTFCNLASINLIKFLDSDTNLDLDGLQNVASLITIAMDILCDLSSYPTPYHRETALKYRTLGLGFSNLGALLMSVGLPYDSPEGRELATDIMAIIQGSAFLQSQDLAKSLGPYPRWEHNINPHSLVISKMKQLALEEASYFKHMSKFIEQLWSKVEPNAPMRNAQSTVIAPVGTISFLMDCETTGIEPVLAFDVRKTLSGSGHLDVSVSECVKRGMETVRKQNNIADDVPDSLIYFNFREVFATSLGTNAVSPQGHVDMMAAVQKFVSGGISKTVNCPSSWTSDDISDIYIHAWKMGVKCIAIYRDGSKAFQPMEALNKDDAASQSSILISSMNPTEVRGSRKRPPTTRNGITHKFELAGVEYYITLNFYPDGAPCELFIKSNKHGSAIAGWCDAFSIAVSLGFQYGVPTAKMIDHFKHMNFSPQGMVVSDSSIKMADSPVDYIFRWLALVLDTETIFKEDLGNLTAKELSDFKELEESLEKIFDQSCPSCGAYDLRRTGTCYTCGTCGSTTGCM